MKKIKEIIVVEGKSDTALLKELFEVDTIETHGLALDKKTLELIKEALALLANSDDEAKVVEFLHTNKFIGEKTYKKLLKKVSK